MLAKNLKDLDISLFLSLVNPRRAVLRAGVSALLTSSADTPLLVSSADTPRSASRATLPRYRGTPLVRNTHPVGPSVALFLGT